MIKIDNTTALYSLVECLHNLRDQAKASQKRVDTLIAEYQLFGSLEQYDNFKIQFKQLVKENWDDDDFTFNRLLLIKPSILDGFLNGHWAIGTAASVFMMHSGVKAIFKLLFEFLDVDRFYQVFQDKLTNDSSILFLKAIHHERIERLFTDHFDQNEQAILSSFYKDLVQLRLDKINTKPMSENAKEFKTYALSHPNKVPLSLIDSIVSYLESSDGQSSKTQQRIGDCLYHLDSKHHSASWNYTGYYQLLESAHLKADWTDIKDYDMHYFKQCLNNVYDIPEDCVVSENHQQKDFLVWDKFKELRQKVEGHSQKMSGEEKVECKTQRPK
ncbi:MAG: hypothetical protein ACON5A_03590 [Candidatus Comchoanobacterales bacterium]